MANIGNAPHNLYEEVIFLLHQLGKESDTREKITQNISNSDSRQKISCRRFCFRD